LSLKGKTTTQHWFTYYQFSRKYERTLLTYTLYITFDDSGI